MLRFFAAFLLMVSGHVVSGQNLIETQPCVDETDQRAQQSASRTEGSCSTFDCPGGCCRFHTAFLVCDKTNLFAHQACICNERTAPPPSPPGNPPGSPPGSPPGNPPGNPPSPPGNPSSPGNSPPGNSPPDDRAPPGSSPPGGSVPPGNPPSPPGNPPSPPGNPPSPPGNPPSPPGNPPSPPGGGGGSGLIERRPCVDAGDAGVAQAALMSEDSCSSLSCSGGCCRFHSVLLVCDTSNRFDHQACVCNDITAPRPGSSPPGNPSPPGNSPPGNAPDDDRSPPGNAPPVNPVPPGGSPPGNPSPPANPPGLCLNGSIWQTLGLPFQNCNVGADCNGVMSSVGGSSPRATCCKRSFCWCGVFDVASAECVQ